jgi:hypothetical protein
LSTTEEAAVAGEKAALSGDGTGLAQPVRSAAPTTPTKLDRLSKLMTPHYSRPLARNLPRAILASNPWLSKRGPQLPDLKHIGRLPTSDILLKADLRLQTQGTIIS